MNPEELIKAAINAIDCAYAPYSNYSVGAALACNEGSIICGCNVENASYGLSNCAERTAVFRAIAEGKRTFTALVIAANGDTPPYPCGACRQVLAEFCDADFPVYIVRSHQPDSYEIMTLGELLPASFHLQAQQKKTSPHTIL